MRQILTVLAAAAVVAAGALASTSAARANTFEPPPQPPIAGQLVCITCPPDYVTSVAYNGAPWPLGFFAVRVTNTGRAATQPSTASITYRNIYVLGHLATVSVPVPPLAAGETRAVFVKEALAYRIVAACADALGDVPERNAANNCV